jgi:hemin uptake protein HemP
MNNPDEAPLYPNSPDYTNSETALADATDLFRPPFSCGHHAPIPRSTPRVRATQLLRGSNGSGICNPFSEFALQ